MGETAGGDGLFEAETSKVGCFAKFGYPKK